MDVDLLFDEIIGDFVYLGFILLFKLGMVGLWCKLYGEVFF